jgi:hypothetical protein
LNEEGDLVKLSDENFIQPSDEDAQCNVLTEEELTSIMMSDAHRTLSKEDSKPEAQPGNEDKYPSPEQHRDRLDKGDHESENIKKLFSSLAKSTKNNSKNKEKNTQWKLRP